MLYDKRWDRKSDPTVNDLIAWLETMPADEHYEYLDPSACLLGQYLRSVGVADVGFASCQLDANPKFCRIAFGPQGDGPHTFGAALERAREYQESHSR